MHSTESSCSDSLSRTDTDRNRFEIVQAYYDRVLEMGRDRWSGKQTPLLADGIDVRTEEPVRWVYDDTDWVMHNLANQQDLFRGLSGLSRLTGEQRYVQAAHDAIAYHFDHLVDETGLLRWGGHQFVDLETLRAVGEFDANTHEFKTHFPYYELMWHVDEGATARFLAALWNAHVLDWETLDMNRHGDYGQDLPLGEPWDHSWGDPEPFFEGDGLTFINIGTDLIWAAGMLHALAEQPSAWRWGERLARMYVKARHPDTGLGAYQYSKPRRREEPPAEGSLENYTYSRYGDRAENQFGPFFGDVAREGWVLWGSRIRTIYSKNAFVQLTLAERLGDDGEGLLEWTVGGLTALAEQSYDPSENGFKPMWADGTDLTGMEYPRTGYYGESGTQWERVEADAEFLRTHVRAYRLTGEDTCWKTARSIAGGMGMGDIGTVEGTGVSLSPSYTQADPLAIFALLECYRTTGHPAFINRARNVANRIVDERFHHGFFLPSEHHRYAKFNTIEPLALLTLDAAIRGEDAAVPPYLNANAKLHGRYDSHGRTYDQDVLWTATV